MNVLVIIEITHTHTHTYICFIARQPYVDLGLLIA